MKPKKKNIHSSTDPITPSQELISPSSPSTLPEKNEKHKTFAVFLLIVVVFFVAYYFYSQPSNGFLAGNPVDEETFKSLINSAQNVYIFMDGKGVSDDIVRNNIYQCGIDFAGSGGLAPKNITVLSRDDKPGCVAVDGVHPNENDCFSKLANGLTIYIKEGNSTGLYSKGMVVGVGSIYKVGTCGINRLN
ncbi:hypothetical protein HZC07_05790 [Candidatus Micrarchaeota archaeon]|nr:hypothetical protein [Candidatus Micrarchaeota archaeon]